MATTTRYYPERARRYEGEGMGNALARVLNGERKADERSKGRVLALVNTLMEILRQSKRDERGRDVAKGMKFGRLVHAFNALARRYSMAPGVYPEEEIGTWSFTEVSKPENPRHQGEFVAARSAITLADNALLERLMKCGQCHRWFFARFSHQTFCSNECRRQHHTSSDRWKAYKRRKAKEYYWLHKSGKVKER